MPTSGNFNYTLTGTSATVTGVSSTPSGGILTIPTSLDGNRVVGVAGGSFQNNASIVKVTFPPYLTTLGLAAFQDCPLTSIIFLGNYTGGLGSNIINQFPFANSSFTALSNIDVLQGNTTWPVRFDDIMNNPTTLFVRKTILPTYVLTYDYNDGSRSPFVVPVSESIETSLISGGTRSGYTFNGWYSLSSGGTRVGLPGASYTINSTRTLYGQWTSTATYTITYDSRGGSFVTSTTGVGAVFISTDVPTRLNFVYVAWTTVANGTGDIYNPGNAYTLLADITLFAQWKCNITFQENGGTTVIDIVGQSEGLVIDPLPPTTRSGYSFKGWFTADSGGTLVGSPYTLAGDATLFAQWELSYYTLTYDSQGGSSIPSQSVNVETRIFLPASTRAGYTLDGWYSASTGGQLVGRPGFDYFPTAADRTLFARWTLVTYTVTYDVQSGSPVSNGSVTVETPVTLLPSTTRPGFVFAGWYTASSGGTFVGTSGNSYTPSPLANTTLYARWSTTQYTLTYNSQGGSAVPPNTQDVGTQIPLPTPTFAGRIFNGWFTATSGGSLVTSPYTLNASTILYAQWTVQYTLTYDSQGGTAVAPNTQNEGASIPLAAAPDRPDYTFLGWYSAPTNGQKVNSPLILDQNVTVYARWYSPPIPSLGVSITEPRNCRPLRTQTLLFPEINYNVRCCPAPVYSLTLPTVDASGVVRFQSTYPLLGTDMYHMFVTNLSETIQYTKYFKKSSSYASGVLAYPGTTFNITVTAFQDGNPRQSFTLPFP